MTEALDDRDHQILALLQAEARLSYAAISRRVHLSASAVQRRVERMIASGVILGAHARVSVETPHPPLIIFLLAELVDDSSETLRRFCHKIAGTPAVIEAHYVTGEADVVLKLGLADMAAYDRFVGTHINASALVRRFKTFASLRSLDRPG